MIRAAILCLALVGAAVPAVAQTKATSASGGTIRVLDKTSGETTDVRMSRGQTKIIGKLQITLGDCRYPTNDPNSDAFGWLEIYIDQDGASTEAFSGWMIASSPALSAMDHPRYDVWMLRCNNQ
ncbi:uncharacterized protein DUF2155 [Aliiruegeria haliotis]|uniref:Uncharacterized protein DUF2155 n=1 Tax=Aliiruegeria haliotis TaxID=1280846 RepID=A0A2T0RVW3_9RHOB|nr:DUF2155 domain-containing protein [Aliiruegeria haliotis]PRY25290.1 uncharacterized protein DUF2155 [Aliiruegeria haliotis]